MLRFCQNWIFGQKMKISNSVVGWALFFKSLEICPYLVNLILQRKWDFFWLFEPDLASQILANLLIQVLFTLSINSGRCLARPFSAQIRFLSLQTCRVDIPFLHLLDRQTRITLTDNLLLWDRALESHEDWKIPGTTNNFIFNPFVEKWP